MLTPKVPIPAYSDHPQIRAVEVALNPTNKSTSIIFKFKEGGDLIISRTAEGTYPEATANHSLAQALIDAGVWVLQASAAANGHIGFIYPPEQPETQNQNA